MPSEGERRCLNLASPQVSWWSLHEHIAPLLNRVGDWPTNCTPQWLGRTRRRRPTKSLLAIFDAAQHHALRLELNQGSPRANISRHRGSSRLAGLGAGNLLVYRLLRGAAMAEAGVVVAEIPYGTDYPDPGWIDEDGNVHGGTVTLTEAHEVFTRWLGDDYDTSALDAVLATAAVERLDGDPLWLLLISEAAATRKPKPCKDWTASAPSSPAPSPRPVRCCRPSPKRERAKDATGRAAAQARAPWRPGHQGRDEYLVDVRRITRRSARRTARGLRRPVVTHEGTYGGLTLDWAGRIALVGAVTTAWDKAHSAIAAMGDRFGSRRTWFPPPGALRPAARPSATRS